MAIYQPTENRRMRNNEKGCLRNMNKNGFQQCDKVIHHFILTHRSVLMIDIGKDVTDDIWA